MVYIIIIAAILLGEWKIKSYIEQKKDFNTREFYCKGKILVQKYHNKGVALNILEKHVTLVKVITGTVIGILLVLLGMLIGKREHRLYALGMSLLIGGALSNFIDRIHRGYVVDYFSFNVGKKLKHIVFNLADMFVIIGSILIVIAEMLGRKK